MSRSSSFDTQSHPCTRWLEWHGEKGLLRYYDRDTKTTVDVPLPFSFLLLDTLACVRGWHDESRSGITSNEVRDTTLEPLVVKAFKHGTLAEGFYRDIRDAVVRQGGKYHASLYLAFRDDAGELRIGNLRLKGAALQSWSEFKKAHKSRLYADAIKVAGVEEGKKGRVVYRVPRFELLPAAAETHAAAQVLDQQLQGYLTTYLQTNRREQADADDQHDVVAPPPQPLQDAVAMTDDDIPF